MRLLALLAAGTLLCSCAAAIPAAEAAIEGALSGELRYLEGPDAPPPPPPAEGANGPAAAV